MTKKGGKMRKSIVGLLLCGVLIGITNGNTVKALSNDSDWGSKTVSIVSQIELDSLPDSYPCDGTKGFIQVKGLGNFDDACIQGESTHMRFARFVHGGIFKYGISLPLEAEFYELRGICSHPRCVFSSAADTFIDHTFLSSWRYGALIYKNFSKGLMRHIDSTTLKPYFQFEPSEPAVYMVKMGEYAPTVEALSISTNGKWALFELKSYGIVRINTETLEAKRVVAPGAEYGLGRDPTFEMAITDDGREAAIVGRGLGVSVVEIDAKCGDQLVQGMDTHFSSTTKPCDYASINTGQLFPGLLYADTPHFSEEGKELRIVARYSNGKIERVTVSPFSFTAKAPIPYIALGDSFTSGEGEANDSFYQPGTNESFFKCHVSTRSYPYLLGIGWNKRTKSVACSGAQTLDIMNTSYNGQGNSLRHVTESEGALLKESALNTLRPGILTQSTFVSAYLPDLLSVSIGGNDAGLVGKLTGCLNIGTCEWAKDPLKRYATSQEIAAIYPKVREVLKELRTDSPIAQVFVVGYPQIINASQNALCDTLTATLLDSDERKFIYETVHYLNSVVKAAAAAEGIAFVDIEDSLKGHELCGEQDGTAMNAVRIGDDIAPIQKLPEFIIFGAESFHPTFTGHAHIAQAILKKYPSTNLISPCSGGCLANNSPPTPSDYWTASGVDQKQVRKQISEESISDPVLKSGKEYAVQSPSLSFIPRSKVSLELHSDIVPLGEVTAGDDGSIQFSGILPKAVPAGYHALHLLGSSLSGELIDVYRTVFIQPESGASASALNTLTVPKNDITSGSNTSAAVDRSAYGGEALGVSRVNPSLNSHTAKVLYYGKTKGLLNLWILAGAVATALVIIFLVLGYSFRRLSG